MHYLCFIVIIFLLIIPLLLFSNKTVTENYNNSFKEKFTTLKPVNVPASNNLDGEYFNIGNKVQEENNLIPNDGKFRFRKQELLYDGIWGANYSYNGNKEKCDWSEKSSMYPLNTDNKDLIYGTDKYLKLPEKDMVNKEIITPPKKYNKNNRKYYKNNKLNRLKEISDNSEVAYITDYHPLEDIDYGFPNSPLAYF